MQVFTLLLVLVSTLIIVRLAKNVEATTLEVSNLRGHPKMYLETHPAKHMKHYLNIEVI